jgi:hypothetical protein
MDDDLISKTPAQNNFVSNSNTDESDEDASSVRIFDITPDLNISPAKDEIEKPSQVVIPEIIPDVPIKNSIPQSDNIRIPTKPDATIPLVTKIQSGPANPPTKTIGQSINFLNKTATPSGDLSPLPGTLQESLSSINKPGNISKEQTVPVKNNIDPNVKSLRTYEKDFAEAMSKRHLSTASFIIAEDKKKDDVPPSPTARVAIDSSVEKNAQIVRNSQPIPKKDPYYQSHFKRNLILVIFSLILIGGGVFSAYYLYMQSPISPVITNTTDTKQDGTLSQTQFNAAIIQADSRTSLNIDGANQTKIISMLNSELDKQQAANSIKEVVLTQAVNGNYKKIAAKDIINRFQIKTPEIFSRSLGSDWMLGIFAAANGKKSYFVVSTNDFFQNSFAGIIQWEKTMPDDFKQFLYSAPAIPEIISTTTATTTIETSNFTLRGGFEDRIIKNKDVREYISSNGQTLFLYSFIDNNKLVMTNDEDALQEIISRLEKSTFIR